MCKNKKQWKNRHEEHLSESDKSFISGLFIIGDFNKEHSIKLGNDWELTIIPMGANRYRITAVPDKLRRKIFEFPFEVEQFAEDILNEWQMEKAKLDKKMLTKILKKVSEIDAWTQRDLQNYRDWENRNDR